MSESLSECFRARKMTRTRGAAASAVVTERSEPGRDYSLTMIKE